MSPRPRQFSPIQGMPPELLSEIFYECLPADDYIIISKNTAPLLVSQVCAEWRAVAYSIPRLWSSLKVTVLPSGSVPPASLIQTWLDRSGSWPLSLSLELDAFPPIPANLIGTVTRILRIFATKSLCWKNLELVLPGSYMLLREIIDCDVPKLHNLTLILRNWQRDEIADINQLLGRATCLLQFSWSNRQSWGSWDLEFDDAVELQISWRNLTHLVFDSWLTLEHSYDILQQCHSLVDCDLRRFSANSSTDPPLPESQPMLYLPYLESLRIYQHILDEGLGSLLDFLVSPRLRNVSITCGRVDSIVWPQPQFRSFLSRSPCFLETLCLEYTGITEEELIQCLQMNTSSLHGLEVYDARGDICVGDKLLTMLTLRKQSISPYNVLCPCLRVLILHGVTLSSDGILAAMLHSRLRNTSSFDMPNRSCVPLEHIDFMFHNDNSRNEADRNYLRHDAAVTSLPEDGESIRM